MSTITLAIWLLSLVIGELLLIPNSVKKNAFQWWHTPWFALIYVGIVYLFYYWIKLPDTFLLKWLFEDYKIEAFYCLACMVAWFPIQAFLRRSSIHDSLIKIYRKFFDKKDEETKKKLPFPYYSSDDSEKVKSRVGRFFYRLTLKSVIIIVTSVYTIALVIVHFYPDKFFPISAFGIISIIPMMEYFFYLSAEVEEERKTDTEKGEKPVNSNFDQLWQQYVDHFDNYAVAWKRNYDENGTLRKDYEKNNNANFNNLFQTFKDEHRGGIIEDCDLLTAFSKLVPFFLQVIKEGHYILIVFDIPKHFSTTKHHSYIQEIASQLTSTLVKRFPRINEITKFIVYDESSTLGVFDNSIVMSPLSVLTRQDMKDKEWMRNIGLITVVNIFDKGVSNLYENRRFSQLLKAVNQNYQILIISALRKELESSLEQTWVTTQEKHFPDGCKITLYPRSDKQFFIGYNFEEWAERFNKVLASRPNDTLYSGSEMLVFPLTKTIGKIEKTVTPIHQLDLAYTNALEGNEEFRRYVNHVKKDIYRIDTESIIEKVTPHILPIDEIIESQVFSVIYDNENNAATAYTKWIHLGNEENFSIVISKPYLFRDYFNANHHFFVNAPFSALQPCMCKSRITLAIILLDMLKDGEIEENAIKSHLLKYYSPEEIVSVPNKLKELFSIYFSDDLAKDLRTKDEVVFDGTKYQTHVKFWLVHPDRINLPYLDVITVKDENGNVLFDILRDLLFQNYNKGQHHSFFGFPYTITDYDQVNKTLNVTRSKDISNDLFCKPCYHIEVRFDKNTLPIKGINMKEPVVFYHHTGIEMAYKMEAYETDINIKPLKWITFEKCYNAPFYSAGSSKIVPVDNTPNRYYSKGKVLKLSLKYLPRYSNCIESIRKMLQILFYEGFQSLFPQHSQYLIVVSAGEGDSILPWIFHDFICNDDLKKGWLSFYFIEDAHIDLGLIGALTYDNVRYLMRYIFDYLLWLTEDSTYPEGYIEYLNRKDFDKMTLLKYGGKELPNYFDVDLIINFIRDQFTTSGDNLLQMQQMRHANNNITGACDFCGKKMKNSEMQRLKDGRMRCPKCSKDAIDTNEQFKLLCDKVTNAFQTHLHIDFSKIVYNAKLISAVELHKLSGSIFNITNGYDLRKYIGFAVDHNVDEFYVEDGYQPDETFGTIAHEMTHIWEYNNDDFKKVRKTNEDLIEGLAVWTDLYLTEKIGATKMKDRMEGWLARDDEYGRGLRFIMNHCPNDPYGYIRNMAKNIHS